MAFQKSTYSSYRGRLSHVDGYLSVYAGLVLLVSGSACYFLSTGINFLAFLFLMAALTCFIHAGLSWLSVNSPFGNFFFVLKRAIEAASVLVLISFVVLEIIISSNSKTDFASESADYLIVLGAGLDGGVPSLILQSRLDGAIEYLRAHPGVIAVVSGGIGSGETVTEAFAMAAYLEAGGISPDRILREERARNTIENIRFSFDIIREHSPINSEPRIAALSNEFHVYRVSLIAKNEGTAISKISVPSPLTRLKVTYYIREYFSVLKVFFVYL